MILFNEITATEWIEKNKGLSIKTIKCNSCRETLSTTIPFMTKDYTGLKTPDCTCGCKLSKAEIAVPRTIKEKLSWSNIISY